MSNIQVGKVDNFKLLERIRKHLSLSIESFCFEMGWPTSSYYDAIKSGIRRNGGIKKPSCPTISKVFDGINYAVHHHKHWQEAKDEIKRICLEELFLYK